MPHFAREALTQRMHRSDLLDRLSTDVRVLFRKRLSFEAKEPEVSKGLISSPLQVGAVSLGFLTLPASKQRERNVAYKHWLEMACNELAHELNRPHSQGSHVLPAKIIRAIRLIKESHHEALSLGDVAKEVGLSRERLSRLFHQTIGITFSEYLSGVRLTEARRQLSSDPGKITEIAFACGFQSLSQFNRRFRATEGISPSEFRRKVQAAR
ncbi:MAG: AraC family transcriptional regulator [Puniceicoccaceae bacterium]|nr:MAG: AraC family transcriptional regulator [Puniceicoccaceae bacterium]